MFLREARSTLAAAERAKRFAGLALGGERAELKTGCPPTGTSWTTSGPRCTTGTRKIVVRTAADHDAEVKVIDQLCADAFEHLRTGDATGTIEQFARRRGPRGRG